MVGVQQYSSLSWSATSIFLILSSFDTFYSPELLRAHRKLRLLYPSKYFLIILWFTVESLQNHIGARVFHSEVQTPNFVSQQPGDNFGMQIFRQRLPRKQRHQILIIKTDCLEFSDDDFYHRHDRRSHNAASLLDLWEDFRHQSQKDNK